MTTGDVVYSLRFSLIKILPEPVFDLGSTAGESSVLTARLHLLYDAKIVQGLTGYTNKQLITQFYVLLIIMKLVLEIITCILYLVSCMMYDVSCIV